MNGYTFTRLYTNILYDRRFAMLRDSDWRLMVELMLIADNYCHAAILPPENKLWKQINGYRKSPDNSIALIESFRKALKRLEYHNLIEETTGFVSPKQWRVIALVRYARAHYQGASWLDKCTRDLVINRDGFICRYCGAIADHIDHVYPKSRGGSNEPSNLVCACAHCNLSKSDKTPGEAGMKIKSIAELMKG